MAHPDPDEKGSPSAHPERAVPDPISPTDSDKRSTPKPPRSASDSTPCSKHAALRGFAEIDVNGDTVAIKLAHRDGQIVQATPEFEDIARAAKRQRIPERQVLDQAKAAAAGAGLVEGGSVPPNFHSATGPANQLIVTPDTSPHSHPVH